MTKEESLRLAKEAQFAAGFGALAEGLQVAVRTTHNTWHPPRHDTAGAIAHRRRCRGILGE